MNKTSLAVAALLTTLSSATITPMAFADDNTMNNGMTQPAQNCQGCQGCKGSTPEETADTNGEVNNTTMSPETGNETMN